MKNEKFDLRNVLTANPDDVVVLEDTSKLVDHELKNALINHKILCGTVVGTERLESKAVVAVVEYKGRRIVMPSSEFFKNPNEDLAANTTTQDKIISSMLGSEIDFVVKGINEDAVVASRKEAMTLKTNMFYISDVGEKPKISEEQVVQARIIAINEYSVRLEVFGVETSVNARDLSSVWVSDISESFNVGDKLLVKVTEINFDDDIVNIKVETVDKSKNNLSLVKPQNKYIGEVVGVKDGQMFISLKIGANAISHKCTDKRTVMKGDTVTFLCTKNDIEKGDVALGLVTKIIKRGNLV